MKYLVINGPNINLLGTRETEIYGKENYEALTRYIYFEAEELGVDVDFFQSNHEGDIVDKIQVARTEYDGIVINPAAYTHYSIAIADALRAVNIPAVEVHLTDITSREEYRRVSVTKDACIDQIVGLGFEGYIKALETLINYGKRNDG